MHIEENDDGYVFVWISCLSILYSVDFFFFLLVFNLDMKNSFTQYFIFFSSPASFTSSIIKKTWKIHSQYCILHYFTNLKMSYMKELPLFIASNSSPFLRTFNIFFQLFSSFSTSTISSFLLLTTKSEFLMVKKERKTIFFL